MATDYWFLIYMVNPQIVDYIRTQLKQGATKDSITSSMTAGGWNSADVEEAFVEASKSFDPIKASQSFAVKPPSQTGHILGKIIKIVILLVIILLCVLFWMGEAAPPRL